MEKNELQDMANNKFLSDIRNIIEQGRRQAYAAVNQVAVLTYWHVGRRIIEEEQHGEIRAKYGSQLTKKLADELVPKYGSAYSKRNLEYYRQFYLSFNDLEIVNTRVHNLTWSHFHSIMHVADPNARKWYVKEASEQMWSVRTLDRNISTQFYGRLCAAKRENEVLPKTEIVSRNDPKEYMPTEEELSREIEQQKRFFLEQHENNDKKDK